MAKQATKYPKIDKFEGQVVRWSGSGAYGYLVINHSSLHFGLLQTRTNDAKKIGTEAELVDISLSDDDRPKNLEILTEDGWIEMPPYNNLRYEQKVQ